MHPANSKGAELEAEVFALLSGLRAQFPELVHVERQPVIQLRSAAGRQRVADLDLWIELPGLRLMYLIECRDRVRQEMDIVFRIQDIRLNSDRNTFIFIHRDPIGPMLDAELQAHGIIRWDLSELAQQVEYWRTTLASIEPEDWDKRESALQTSSIGIRRPGTRRSKQMIHWARLQDQPILGYVRMDSDDGAKFFPTARLSAMHPEAAVDLLRRGADGVQEWNARRNADAGHVDLMHCDLSSLDLRGVDLSDANANDVSLSNCDLRDANLSWANLRRSDFRGAKLAGANLEKAGLDGADFRGVDLSESEGTQALCDARGLDLWDLEFIATVDEQTRFPEGSPAYFLQQRRAT